MAEIKESMELGYYFMNLEDKYWGLFLISLAVLFFSWKEERVSFRIWDVILFLSPLSSDCLFNGKMFSGTFFILSNSLALPDSSFYLHCSGICI